MAEVNELRKHDGEELVLLREIYRLASAMLCGDVLREHENALRLKVKEYHDWKQAWISRYQ